MDKVAREVEALQRISRFHRETEPEMVTFYTWSPQTRDGNFAASSGYEYALTHQKAVNHSGERYIYVGQAKPEQLCPSTWDEKIGQLWMGEKEYIILHRFTK